MSDYNDILKNAKHCIHAPDCLDMKLEAENTKLIGEVAFWTEKWKTAANSVLIKDGEIEKLRAALEKITYDHPISDEERISLHYKIAKEALASGGNGEKK